MPANLHTPRLIIEWAWCTLELFQVPFCYTTTLAHLSYSEAHNIKPYLFIELLAFVAKLKEEDPFSVQAHCLVSNMLLDSAHYVPLCLSCILG
jgi:hypothetical protein